MTQHMILAVIVLTIGIFVVGLGVYAQLREKRSENYFSASLVGAGVVTIWVGASIGATP